MRLYQGLVELGYLGAYDSIQRVVKQWKVDNKKSASSKQAFVPLAFQPGEVCQFDWSMETVEIAGKEQRIKVAHFRLSYSRKMCVVAYPRETQEMLMDAHDKAFACYGGVPVQMVYDNLKTVVDTVFTGKERKFNRRFMALANHYLFEPVACTPAAGWEKGQVENQVGNIREWLFTPRAKFDTFATLNNWLAQRCEELASRPHPTIKQSTIAACFQQEQPLLRKVTTPFSGYIEQLVKVSNTCLVNVDRNRYSVPSKWGGQIVSVRLSAFELNIVVKDTLIATHPRCFLRDQLSCDPWHYLAVLEKKPGALRHGLPFQQWDLPESIQHVRNKLLQQRKGDCAFVALLVLAQEVGIDALDMACELAMSAGVITVSIVQNELRRLTEPVRPNDLPSCEHLQLTTEPHADYQRYDYLLGAHHVH